MALVVLAGLELTELHWLFPSTGIKSKHYYRLVLFLSARCWLNSSILLLILQLSPSFP